MEPAWATMGQFNYNNGGDKFHIKNLVVALSIFINPFSLSPLNNFGGVVLLYMYLTLPELGFVISNTKKLFKNQPREKKPVHCIIMIAIFWLRFL